MAAIKVSGLPTTDGTTLTYQKDKARRSSFSGSPKKGDAEEADIKSMTCDAAAEGTIVRMTYDDSSLELQLKSLSMALKLVYDINDAYFGTLSVKELKKRLQER